MSGAAFDDNHHTVPSVPFPFEEMDGPDTVDVGGEIREGAAELLMRLFETFRCRTPQATANAISVISYLAAGESVSETARKCHLSRAAVRKIASKFHKSTGVRLAKVPPTHNR